MTDEVKKIAKISVDRNACIGAGPCAVAAESVFELDPEQKAVMKLKGGETSTSDAEKSALEDAGVTDETLMTAAQSCPVKAIHLFDEDGNQIFP